MSLLYTMIIGNVKKKMQEKMGMGTAPYF